MKKVISGPVGSGKTTALKNLYLALLNQGVKSDNILVMVRSALEVSQWRRTLNPRVSGSLHIYTYFGFVQNQLTKFWPLVEQKLPAAHRYLQPVFMTVEAAHYLMRLMVEEARATGGFVHVKSTAENIAIQLIDNLNQAAINGFSVAAAAKRLQVLGAAGNNKEKTASYHDAVAVMQQFRRECLTTQSIDYSLAVELYHEILLKNAQYLKMLRDQWSCLIVDDLEETVPTAQDLILNLFNTADRVCLGYNPKGGHTLFFGAYPEGVRQNILPFCEVEEINRAGDQETREFAEYLAKIIAGQSFEIREFTTLKGQIVTDLRGAMLEQVVEQIEKLLAAGTEPGEIAVITPAIDKVLEFTLTNKLVDRKIHIANLARSKRLLDLPFAKAMITLAVLANPEWKMEGSFSDLVQSLCLLLQLDPVRAALIAEETLKNNLTLPDIDEVNLRDRVGYRNSEHYQELRNWVIQRQQAKPDLELLFQQAFTELLAPLLPGEEDLLACRQLLDSAVKLRRVLNRYRPEGEDSLGYSFIDMVRKGTLAADVLYRPPADRNKVILTSPVNFVLNPCIDKVKYQFWVDIGGHQWLRSIAKELANPWVMSRRWSDSQVWDDDIDQNIRLNKLVLLVSALLGKCTVGIYTAYSHLNSQGWEQDSILVDVFDIVQLGVGQS